MMNLILRYLSLLITTGMILLVSEDALSPLVGVSISALTILISNYVWYELGYKGED